jgi:hypothetical protein
LGCPHVVCPKIKDSSEISLYLHDGPAMVVTPCQDLLLWNILVKKKQKNLLSKVNSFSGPPRAYLTCLFFSQTGIDHFLWNKRS